MKNWEVEKRENMNILWRRKQSQKVIMLDTKREHDKERIRDF